MAAEQIFIGLAISTLCLVGMLRESWFLRETKKGQRLAKWCGSDRALWVLRGLFTVGLLFGLALASGVVNPIQWSGVATAAPRVASAPRPTQRATFIRLLPNGA